MRYVPLTRLWPPRVRGPLPRHVLGEELIFPPRPTPKRGEAARGNRALIRFLQLADIEDFRFHRPAQTPLPVGYMMNRRHLYELAKILGREYQMTEPNAKLAKDHIARPEPRPASCGN